jgi:hypothetical protein
MNLRSRLIHWALCLQSPPFLWFFQFYYWIAIQLSRRLISRIEGVRSIYLSGSWVRQEVIYGLSDIDFKIFVVGDKNPEPYKAIRRIFSLLRRFFPMLGPPDEKGIYFLAAFPADYRQYPLVQHLFDERFFKHRLLWGDDLLRELPLKTWNELDQGECLFGRLKDWIERVHLLADCAELCQPQKQHLFFKAVCDVGLLAIRIDSPEFRFSHRSEVMRQISAEMGEPFHQQLENLIRENQAFYRIQLNSLNENFQLFKKMVAYCSDKSVCRDKSLPFPLEGEFCATLYQPADAILASTLSRFSPHIQKVSVIHWPQLPLNPFDLRLFNAPAYLVDCAQPLSLPEFHGIKAFYCEHLRDKAVLLLREHTQFLSSVDSELVDHWGGFPGGSDLLHFLLKKEGSIALTQLERKRIEIRVRSFQEQLATTLSHPEFGRMDLSLFPLFLFNALRVLIFSIEFQQGKWMLPFTPGQVVDFLAHQTPLSPAFPNKLKEQYELATPNGRRFDERLMPKSRLLLADLLDISQNGRSWESLKKLNNIPDQHRLNISVAIITANRPLQLQRCLHSLMHLSRSPEELLIVDSGGESSTRKVFEKFQPLFPIHYLHIDQKGVAFARNVAARTAHGEIVAFVDDDASVTPDWLERLERVFLRDPRTGLAAGSVLNMKCGRKDLIWKFMEVVEEI